MQYSGAAEAAGRNLGVTVTTARVHGPAEIDAAMATLGREPGGGLILPPDGYTLTYRTLIVELAARHRLPAIYGIRDFAAEGGLVFFGVDVKDQYRQAAGYIDRILRGERPGDLPVQQPTKFEFVINLKTAKVLGLEVPLLLQQRADEVIE
jgi:putative ABC transport system substrate-binding protein